MPLITPFRDGRVDTPSLQNLVERLIADGVSGLVALGTTGECPVVSRAEHLEIARVVKDAAKGRVPVLVGAGGPDTRQTIALVHELEGLGVDGILSVCPYYSRPNQAGILAHFQAIAAATSLPIVLYNIPYRTGVNMENETIRALAAHPNIVGLKDSCGNIQQSMGLLREPPGGLFDSHRRRRLVLCDARVGCPGRHFGCGASRHSEIRRSMAAPTAKRSRCRANAMAVACRHRVVAFCRAQSGAA